MTSAIDFRDLGWRNFIRKHQGLEAKLSTMDDIWCGYWARNLKLDVPELFIYSGSDFYIPASYIEGQVIPDRNKVSRDVLVCRFNRSPHVEHLRKNRVAYTEAIKQMVEKVEKK
ncbi:uncharacterized protein LOC111706428 isoform X2 [Eurytemora carolleeae]|nr:uncharacterized protein LOC111706428 isoform X2 [Eurytemora carolleeae]|eukprot:XP_023335074.1 uncharacterized protein LOC111706428 isoform X2 [Eurytemora affinis]